MDPVPSKAHSHMEQVENHAKYLHGMGNRTMEDIDAKQLLDEFKDAKNNLVHLNRYLPKQ